MNKRSVKTLCKHLHCQTKQQLNGFLLLHLVQEAPKTCESGNCVNVLENEMQLRHFGSKRDELSRKCRKVYDE
jgi:hypothetical protein